jgi:hypothetical protein
MSWQLDPNEIPRTVLGPSRPRLPQYRSAHAYAAATTWLLGFEMLLAAAAIYSTIVQIGLLVEIRQGRGGYSAADVSSNHVHQVAIDLCRSAVGLAAAVAILLWIRRSHRNLQALGNSKLKYSPGWAVTCWFVPILNLVCPCQVMIEIWKGSDLRNVNVTDPRRGKGSILVGCWWASFVVMVVARLTAAWNSLGCKSIDDVVLASLYWILHDILLVFWAALMIAVVRRVDRNQGIRRAIIESRAKAGPVPAPSATG